MDLQDYEYYGLMATPWDLFRGDTSGWEDRYNVLFNGVIVASEYHRRSPATRWYTQTQAIQLYRQAGFTEIRLMSSFTEQIASAEEQLFTVIGTHP